MRYRTQKLVIFGILAVYFAFALSLRSKQDVYPVFSWSLFSEIPNPRERYVIELHRLGDTRYDPPLRFSEMTFVFERIRHSPTEYTPRIGKLGEAIDRHDIAAIEKQTKEIENMFLGDAYEYELLRVYVDPVEYWKTGRYEVLESMATVDSEP